MTPQVLSRHKRKLIADVRRTIEPHLYECRYVDFTSGKHLRIIKRPKASFELRNMLLAEAASFDTFAEIGLVDASCGGANIIPYEAIPIEDLFRILAAAKRYVATLNLVPAE